MNRAINLVLVVCLALAIAPVACQEPDPSPEAVQQSTSGCTVGFRVVESESDIVLRGRLIRPISQSFDIKNGDQISQGLRGVLSLPIADQDAQECAPPETGESLAFLLKASGQQGYSAVGSLPFYPSNLTVSVSTLCD